MLTRRLSLLLFGIIVVIGPAIVFFIVLAGPAGAPAPSPSPTLPPPRVVWLTPGQLPTSHNRAHITPSKAVSPTSIPSRSPPHGTSVAALSLAFPSGETSAVTAAFGGLLATSTTAPVLTTIASTSTPTPTLIASPTLAPTSVESDTLVVTNTPTPDLPVAASLALTDQLAGDLPPIPMTSFSATSIRSLYANVAWFNLVGMHTLRLRFYLPDGNLYQEVPLYFNTQANIISPDELEQQQPVWELALVSALDDPVMVQMTPLVRFGGGTVTYVWGELPVAGTWAQRLLGEWRVDILLDQDSTVWVSAPFALTP